MYARQMMWSSSQPVCAGRCNFNSILINSSTLQENAGAGFTRVIIGELKAEVVRQLAEEAGVRQLCRSLAHLYHYYLHGDPGNRSLSS